MIKRRSRDAERGAPGTRVRGAQRSRDAWPAGGATHQTTKFMAAISGVWAAPAARHCGARRTPHGRVGARRLPRARLLAAAWPLRHRPPTDPLATRVSRYGAPPPATAAPRHTAPLPRAGCSHGHRISRWREIFPTAASARRSLLLEGQRRRLAKTRDYELKTHGLAATALQIESEYDAKLRALCGNRPGETAPDLASCGEYGGQIAEHRAAIEAAGLRIRHATQASENNLHAISVRTLRQRDLPLTRWPHRGVAPMIRTLIWSRVSGAARSLCPRPRMPRVTKVLISRIPTISRIYVLTSPAGEATTSCFGRPWGCPGFGNYESSLQG